MTTVLFIHSAGPQGADQGSDRLLQGLKTSVPGGIDLVAPLMPEPHAPSAEAWIAAVWSAISGIEGDLVLVGHSLGGSTILQALARHGVPGTVGGVVLLSAPFWGEGGWNMAEYALAEDAESALVALPRLIILQGDQDTVVESDHPELYKDLLRSAEIRWLTGVDHEAADAAPSLYAAVHDIVGPKL
jgi:predicted alpha/beta hydrolase family esterase